MRHFFRGIIYYYYLIHLVRLPGMICRLICATWTYLQVTLDDCWKPLVLV